MPTLNPLSWIKSWLNTPEPIHEALEEFSDSYESIITDHHKDMEIRDTMADLEDSIIEKERIIQEAEYFAELYYGHKS